LQESHNVFICIEAEQDTTTVAGQKSVDVVANEQDTEEAPVGT